MNLIVHNFSKTNTLRLERLSPLVASYFDQLVTINLIKTTSRYMQSLNKEFRGVDESTDVLSFPSPLENNPGGDVYLCIDEIKANAKYNGVRLEEELVRTAIHGILHLGGYTHTGKLGEREEEIYKIQELLVKKALRRHPS